MEMSVEELSQANYYSYGIKYSTVHTHLGTSVRPCSPSPLSKGLPRSYQLGRTCLASSGFPAVPHAFLLPHARFSLPFQNQPPGALGVSKLLPGESLTSLSELTNTASGRAVLAVQSVPDTPDCVQPLHDHYSIVC